MIEEYDPSPTYSHSISPHPHSPLYFNPHSHPKPKPKPKHKPSALILSISLSFSTYYYYSPLDVSPLEDDADQNTRMGGLLSIFGIIVSVLGFFGDYLAVGSCEKKITADPDAVVKVREKGS